MNTSRYARFAIGVYISGYGFLIRPYINGITEGLYLVLQPAVADTVASLVSVILFLAGGIIIGNALLYDKPNNITYYALSSYGIWVVLSINAGIQLDNYRIVWTVIGAFVHMFIILKLSHDLSRMGDTHARNTIRDRQSHSNYIAGRRLGIIEQMAKRRHIQSSGPPAGGH